MCNGIRFYHYHLCRINYTQLKLNKMRKLILVIAVMAITAGAYAQTDSVNKKMNPPDINKTEDRLNQDRDNNKTDDVLNQNRDINKTDDVLNQNREINKTDDVLNQNREIKETDDALNQNRELNNNQNQNWQNNPVDVNKSHSDGVIMQNGKMMKVKNGQMTILEDDMTLSNGTKISSDGTCIKKDGSKVTMKEGQHMDNSGDVTPKNPDEDRNMYLVPTSTRKN